MHLPKKSTSTFLSVLLSSAISLSTVTFAFAADEMEMISKPMMNESVPTVQRHLPVAYYSDAPKSDEDITSMIKEQLALEPGVDINMLNLDTVDGVVMISGTVSSQQLADRVVQIARSAGAVKLVESTVSTKMPDTASMHNHESGTM